MWFFVDGGGSSATIISTTGLLTISDCFFENNKADLGGALHIKTNGIIILEKNIFVRNKATFLSFIGSCSVLSLAGSQTKQLLSKNIYYLNSAEDKGFKNIKWLYKLISI